MQCGCNVRQDGYSLNSPRIWWPGGVIKLKVRELIHVQQLGRSALGLNPPSDARKQARTSGRHIQTPWAHTRARAYAHTHVLMTYRSSDGYYSSVSVTLFTALAPLSAFNRLRLHTTKQKRRRWTWMNEMSKAWQVQSFIIIIMRQPSVHVTVW